LRTRGTLNAPAEILEDVARLSYKRREACRSKADVKATASAARAPANYAPPMAWVMRTCKIFSRSNRASFDAFDSRPMMDANALSDTRLPTILLIDDEQELLVAWALLLELEGFHVVTTIEARKGVELAHRLHPALVITDLMMPDMNGVDVCLALKADPSLDGVPVILWSASPEIPADVMCECTLHKPVTRETLLANVQGLLRTAFNAQQRGAAAQ
jgi:CheY-like chemotaxis protein